MTNEKQLDLLTTTETTTLEENTMTENTIHFSSYVKYGTSSKTANNDLDNLDLLEYGFDLTWMLEGYLRALQSEKNNNKPVEELVRPILRDYKLSFILKALRPLYDNILSILNGEKDKDNKALAEISERIATLNNLDTMPLDELETPKTVKVIQNLYNWLVSQYQKREIALVNLDGNALKRVAIYWHDDELSKGKRYHVTKKGTTIFNAVDASYCIVDDDTISIKLVIGKSATVRNIKVHKALKGEKNDIWLDDSFNRKSETESSSYTLASEINNACVKFLKSYNVDNWNIRQRAQDIAYATLDALFTQLVGEFATTVKRLAPTIQSLASAYNAISA